MWNYVLGTLVLCGLFEHGVPIMCYECNSAINSMCSENVPPHSLMRNCSDLDQGVTHTLCRKMIQHVDYGINGKLPESRIIRSCGWDESKYKGKCYHRAGFGGRQEVCSCMTDLCNNGQQATIAIYLLVTSTLTVTFSRICQ